MKYFVITLAIVAMLAGSSLAAGMNPNCKLFVVFEQFPADYAAIEAGRRIDPGAFEEFTAYIGICDFTSVKTVTIKMGIDSGVATTATYESLFPGGLALGGWEEGGVTLASTTPVTSAVEGAYYIFATANAYAFGDVAGEVRILDHDDYPRWIVDPEDGIDNYCIWQNGGILMDPTPIETECFGDTPVELQTWGSIKALYK